jgi:hypothetical protein
MKKIIFCFVLLPLTVALSQEKTSNTRTWQHPGAPQGYNGNNHPPVSQLQHLIAPRKITGASYSATFYTFNDIAVFSYLDSTSVTITTPSGTTIASINLNADSFDTLSPGNGFYIINGNKPFAVLTGDAVTSYASGYFATDANGSGVSTKLNTWMMNNLSDLDTHFILFSYSGVARFSIKDLGTGNLLFQGSIDTTGYFDFPNVSLLEGKAIQVTSDKPVSALSYNDQGYYVPSANGTFAGNLFYGFSGYSPGLENSITLTSYSDTNAVVITNLSNGDTILVDTLNHWQVKTLGVFNDTFWKVTSSGVLTAADLPFKETWERPSSPHYYFLAQVADSTGKNVGTSFIAPTSECDLCISSYAANNEVKVVSLGDTSYPYQSRIQLKDTVLQDGGVLVVSLPKGDSVYQVQSTGGVSVVEASLGTGAAFVPLNNSGTNLPDLAIAQSDIGFSPDTTFYQTAQKISVNLTVRNYGTAAASNVTVVAYDGNPGLGFAATLTSQNIPVVSAGDSANLSFPFAIPPGAKYHAIYVKVDPGNLITELNRSNNESYRYLLPNNYLNSKYAVYFSAPNSLKLQAGTLTPNPFTATADIFNDTSVALSNIEMIVTASGITVLSGVTDTTINSFPESGHLKLSWNLQASTDSAGIGLLNIIMMRPYIDTSIVTFGILVPDTVTPPTPQGLVAQTDSSGPGRVKLTWISDSVRDIAGYKIYYSTDSTNLLGGTGAQQGNSPIYISNVDSSYVYGLANGANYWFAASAYDFSSNESALSQPVKIFIVTKVQQSGSLPQTFALLQNFPNPFNPSTIINYQLPMASTVTLKVYDVLGREVAALVNEKQSAGYYSVTFNASNLPSGVYFYRIMAGKFMSVKKLMVVK